MIRLKFGEGVPFPTKPGMYIRVVCGDSESAGKFVITQGHVMNFLTDDVMLMNDHQLTKDNIIHQGDEKCRVDGLTVLYVPIVGLGFTKPAENKPTNPAI